MKWPILALSILVIAAVVIPAQKAPDSDPVLQTTAPFTMPQSALDAKIGGRVVIALSIDSSGKPTKAELVAGPVWPCDSRPTRALEELRSSLRDAMMNNRFSPAVRKGKLVAKDIWLTIELKNPSLDPEFEIDNMTGKKRAKVIHGGFIGGKANYLPQPSFAAATAYRGRGSVTVQVLVDEQGKVIRAGIFNGAEEFHTGSREAACKAEFSPSTLEGRPVKVSGMITYSW